MWHTWSRCRYTKKNRGESDPAMNLAQNSVVIAIILAFIIAACGCGSSEVALDFGEGEMIICGPTDETGRKLIGWPILVSQEPEIITRVSLVNAQELTIIEAVVTPPRSDGGIIVGTDSWPPSSNPFALDVWGNRVPAESAELAAGGKYILLIGLELGDSNYGFAEDIRVDYEGLGGKVRKWG